MKKLILLLLLYNLFNERLFSQGYISFPDSYAVWRVNYEDCQSMFYPTKKFQYEISGDTIIGLYNYKKINREGDCCLIINSNAISNGYIGGMRDDSLNKRVYIILKDSTNEMLLYDFGLHVGDTLLGFYAMQSICNLPNGYLTVQSIDSILVNNSYRKRLNFYNQIDEHFASIIEGIGSNKGLLEGYYFHADCCDRNLVCFKSDNTLLYPDTVTSYSCDLNPVNIDEQLGENISIFPNPVKTILTVHGKSLISSTVYDMTGHKIKISNREQINLENVSCGVYYIEIEKSNYVKLYRKFIKN